MCIHMPTYIYIYFKCSIGFGYQHQATFENRPIYTAIYAI